MLNLKQKYIVGTLFSLLFSTFGEAVIRPVKDFIPPSHGFHLYRRDRMSTEELHVYQLAKGFVCQSDVYPYVESKSDPLKSVKLIPDSKTSNQDLSSCAQGVLSIEDNRDGDQIARDFCFEDQAASKFWSDLKKACTPEKK